MRQKRLTPSFTRRWVKALRSGKYQQGQDSLVDYEYDEEVKSYCCVGVAGCVLGVPEDIMWTQGLPEDLSLVDRNLFPMELHGGLNGSIRNPIVATLVNKNDGGVSFSEIADYIESEEFKTLVKENNNK